MEKIKTTWIIDDDPIQTFVAKRNLESINFSQNIRTLENGQNALEELKNLSSSKDSIFPDVIFLDINMPQLDGWHFLEEFEKLSLEKRIDIYLVTASVDPIEQEKAKTYKSLSGLLIKPLRKEKLQGVLDKYEQ